VIVGLAFGCASPPKPATEPSPIPPRSYDCRKTDVPPTIDGRLDDDVWRRTPWTESFVDIEGHARAVPRFSTYAKLAWDDIHLDVAARLEEPHVWGTLTRRDSIIYNDNDFEIFIDPAGDGVEYYEIEINALGTQLDLYLHTPYSRGGRRASIGTASGCARPSASKERSTTRPTRIARGRSNGRFRGTDFARLPTKSRGTNPSAAGVLRPSATFGR
jgi:hypothetical protein